MTRAGLLRSAALLMLVLAAIALGLGALRASAALDQRFEESRYVVQDLGGCWIQEWRPFEFYTACPWDT